MRKLKWVLLAIVVIPIALVVTAYAIVSTYSFDEVKAIAQQEARKATGRDLVIDGPLDVALSLSPAVTISDVSLANIENGSRDNMINLDRFELQVELIPLLSGDIEVTRLVLVGADILLETDAEGNPNWRFTPTETGETAEEETTTADQARETGRQRMPNLNSVSIEDSRVTYRNGDTGESMTLSLDSATISGSGELLDLDLEGGVREVPFSFAGSVGGLDRLTGGGDYPVKLEGQLADADISLNGNIISMTSDPRLDLQVQLEGESLAAFSELGGNDLPDLGPYSFAGHVEGEMTALFLNGMTLEVGESDLSGDAGLDLTGERPRITGDLQSTLLDLADFQMESTDSSQGSEEDGDTEGSGDSESQFLIPETQLPLEALRGLDAQLRARVATLRLPSDTEVSDVDVTLALSNGRLDVTPLQAGISGGMLDGEVMLDSSSDTPRLAIDMTMEGFDYGRLLRERDLSEDVEGTADINLDLEGTGSSPRALASSLNGRSEIIGHEGVITNRLLAVVSTGLSEIMGPLLGDNEQTRLNCIVSRFAFENGVATSQAQLLDTSTFSVAGGGRIDLRDESLNMNFDTKTRQTALVSLAIPFNVRGTLKNPSFSPDPAGTVEAAAKLFGSGKNPEEILGSIMSGGSSDSETQEEEDNPCLTALGQTEGQTQSSSETDAPSSESSQGEDAVKGVAEDLEEGLKGLFGD
ncbi:AsmA family protein [Fodinicurvata fenggangensis]|uniref:AsmA family protein n=1 Tax=Fodinicurvata fenggangensis TaxID=1121830 RepID=UPI000479005E|nr:AsmA family protein [Fodinicurvata fenggangensis]